MNVQFSFGDVLFIELEKPFLGFCLGCQFLGEVVGGEVVKSTPPEIGILNIEMNQKKNNDQLFSNFPSTMMKIITMLK